MTKIVRLFEDESLPYEQKIIGNLAEIVVRPSFTEEDVINNAKDADFIICGYEPITARVLEQLPNLKMVVFRSIGFNCIDLKKANEIGLPVAHLSTYCVHEVADYVVSAILLHNRRILDFNESVKRDHKWQYDLFPSMRRLACQSVGFLGFGNIPKLIAKRLAPFGCQMFAYDPFLGDDVFAEYQIQRATKEQIFEQCNYISSHLPLAPDTHKMLDKPLFDRIPRSAVFINSSRGGVVNESDLIEALNTGKIECAILDVLQDEYPDLDTNPFMSMHNVILTPHVAFYSMDAMQEATKDSISHIVNYLENHYDKIDLVNRQYAIFK